MAGRISGKAAQAGASGHYKKAWVHWRQGAEEKGRSGKVARGESPLDSPLQTADMEPASSNGPVAKTPREGVDKRASINVHSKRKRLADPDGISCKAVVDALVLAGVLPDDNAQFVKEVTFTQEKSDIEETIIDVVWEI